MSNAAKGSVFKRCHCTTPVLDPDGNPVVDASGKPKRKALGAACPQLRRADGALNPRHGSWMFLLDVPTPDGGRTHIRQGGHPDRDAATAALDHVRHLLQLAESADRPDATRAKIADAVRAAIRAKKPLPTTDDMRRRLRLRQPLDAEQSTATYLQNWLAGKFNLEPTTLRAYQSHLDNYLIPYLGDIPLTRLTPDAITTMFIEIREANEQAVENNAARTRLHEAARTHWTNGDKNAAKAAREALAALPPYRRPTKPASWHRIRATLRSALSDAVKRRLIDINAAKLIDLPTVRRPRTLVWTDERLARWRTTGQLPGPVMVWTAAQTATFLRHATTHPLFALYDLMAHTGVRRGEACGARTIDLDLDLGKQLTVSNQIVQLGWETRQKQPKSDAGERVVPLDPGRVTILRNHRVIQQAKRDRLGDDWIDSGLLFTQDDGAPLHPAHVTAEFHRIAREADLPPIRLHDLRHGTATHALAAGVDIKVLQHLLGHSSAAFTRDTYQGVIPELGRTAVTAIANTFTSET